MHERSVDAEVTVAGCQSMVISYQISLAHQVDKQMEGIPFPVKLHDIVLGELGDVTVRPGLRPHLSIGVQEILDAILRLEFVFGDEVVEVHQLNGDECLILAQPGYLFLRLLDVALQVQLQLERGHCFAEGVEHIVTDVTDDGVAPVHERDFFVLLERFGIILLDKNGTAERDLLVPKRVFGVFGKFFGIGSSASADYRDCAGISLVDGSVTGGNWVDESKCFVSGALLSCEWRSRSNLELDAEVWTEIIRTFYLLPRTRTSPAGRRFC